MADDTEQHRWHVVGRVSHDASKNRGVFEVNSAHRTREAAEQAARKEPRLMVFPRTFNTKEEPKPGKKYSVPPGLDPNLDQVVEHDRRYNRLNALGPHEDHRLPEEPKPDGPDGSGNRPGGGKVVSLDEYRQRHAPKPKP